MISWIVMMTGFSLMTSEQNDPCQTEIMSEQISHNVT